MKKILLWLCLLWQMPYAMGQLPNEPTPPMGFMTWNYFGIGIDENILKTVVDSMVSTGLRDAGYTYLFIDDGWQGGRDNKNNLIPDPKKFPSGMKALADYVHNKGMKIGLYSDAAPLTCGGYTGSLNFEEQDAKTLALWGIDYLKYDYCGAPPDWQTAIARYAKMSNALQKSGRAITLSICEWGDRDPWLWARKAGGQLWRTTADVRDKWKATELYSKPADLHAVGAGILDIIEVNAPLDAYVAPNGWNDADMLVVGLYGKKGLSSSDLGGSGCSETEYQTQMSMWSLMAAPLMITCDVRNMDAATKRILLNKDLLAINQDKLGKQARRIKKDTNFQLFAKPLQNGDIAFGILNYSDQVASTNILLDELNLAAYQTKLNVWTKQTERISKNQWKETLQPHETKVYVLKRSIK